MSQENTVGFYPNFQKGTKSLSAEQLKVINQDLAVKGMSPDTARTIFGNRDYLHIPDDTREQMVSTLMGEFGMGVIEDKRLSYEIDRDLEAALVVEMFDIKPADIYADFMKFDPKKLGKYVEFPGFDQKVTFSSYVTACFTAVLAAKILEGGYVDATNPVSTDPAEARIAWIQMENNRRGIESIENARAATASHVDNMALINKDLQPQMLEEVFLKENLSGQMLTKSQVRTIKNGKDTSLIGTGLATPRITPFSALEPIS